MFIKIYYNAIGLYFHANWFHEFYIIFLGSLEQLEIVRLLPKKDDTLRT